ncbi:hypothetical protein [Kitasatospora sp. NPDC088346]|uniref:hypothetical protein n=1 Tax=Kitasatospora sp. NPDC088346 TaxID=3364073 RepID=UPI0037F7B0A1
MRALLYEFGEPVDDDRKRPVRRQGQQDVECVATAPPAGRWAFAGMAGELVGKPAQRFCLGGLLGTEVEAAGGAGQFLQENRLALAVGSGHHANGWPGPEIAREAGERVPLVLAVEKRLGPVDGRDGGSHERARPFLGCSLQTQYPAVTVASRTAGPVPGPVGVAQWWGAGCGPIMPRIADCPGGDVAVVEFVAQGLADGDYTVQ